MLDLRLLGSLCAADGHLDIVELLIDFGATITSGGYSPLYVAANRGHKSCVAVLLRSGPLRPLPSLEDPEILNMLLEADADVNCKNMMGETPLMELLSLGCTEVGYPAHVP